MKIIIERHDDCTETLVNVYCSTEADAQTEELIHKIQDFSVALKAVKNGETYKLRLKDICYIECVDDKTFLYTDEDTYESPLKLYQIEEELVDTDFVRISKSVILNINQLDSVKPLLNAKIEARLLNGERLLINRHYVAEFRKKFGV